MLAEAQRQSLVRQGERLTLATDFAAGVNKPELLKDRWRSHEDVLGLRESTEDAVKKGVDLAAAVTRAAEMDRLLAQQKPEASA